jgi:DNA topoisomerase-1
VLDEVTETAERMQIAPEPTGENCPNCGRPLVFKNGRFGEFIACTGYPECKYTRNIIKTTGIKCPKCGDGELVRRKAGKGKAKGRFFYGCSRYPECDYVSWKKPAGPKKTRSDVTEGTVGPDAEDEFFDTEEAVGDDGRA